MGLVAFTKAEALLQPADIAAPTVDAKAGTALGAEFAALLEPLVGGPSFASQTKSNLPHRAPGDVWLADFPLLARGADGKKKDLALSSTDGNVPLLVVQSLLARPFASIEEAADEREGVASEAPVGLPPRTTFDADPGSPLPPVALGSGLADVPVPESTFPPPRTEATNEPPLAAVPPRLPVELAEEPAVPPPLAPPDRYQATAQEVSGSSPVARPFEPAALKAVSEAAGPSRSDVPSEPALLAADDAPGLALVVPPEATDPPPVPDDDGALLPTTDDPPPETPPRPPANAASVVRSVGNAHKDLPVDEPPKLPPADRPRGLPHASEQGIAHASDRSAVAQLRADVSPPPPAPAPSPEASPAPPPPAIEQVTSAVIERIDEGGGEARIRLDPPDLGSVTIHVKISGEHVRVDVHADHPEAMQLLRDNTADLSSLLGHRGLDLADVYVGLGGRHPAEGQSDQAGDRRGRGDRHDFAAVLGLDQPPAVEIHNRLRAAYNPDGAHIYRI